MGRQAQEECLHIPSAMGQAGGQVGSAVTSCTSRKVLLREAPLGRAMPCWTARIAQIAKVGVTVDTAILCSLVGQGGGVGEGWQRRSELFAVKSKEIGVDCGPTLWHGGLTCHWVSSIPYECRFAS